MRRWYHLLSASLFPQINCRPIYARWRSDHLGWMWHRAHTHTNRWKVVFQHLQLLCPQEPLSTRSSSFWPRPTFSGLQHLTYLWPPFWSKLSYYYFRAIPSPMAHFPTLPLPPTTPPSQPSSPLYSLLAVHALNILFLDLPQALSWGRCFLAKTSVLMSVRVNCTEAD